MRKNKLRISNYLSLTQSCRYMNTVDVTVVAFAEYHAVKRSIKDDSDSHHVFFTLNLEVLDLGHVCRLGDLPWVRIETWSSKTWDETHCLIVRIQLFRVILIVSKAFHVTKSTVIFENILWVQQSILKLLFCPNWQNQEWH